MLICSTHPGLLICIYIYILFSGCSWQALLALIIWFVYVTLCFANFTCHPTSNFPINRFWISEKLWIWRARTSEALREKSENLRSTTTSEEPPRNLRRPPRNLRGTSEDLRGTSEDLRGPPRNLRGPPRNLRGPPRTSEEPPRTSEDLRGTSEIAEELDFAHFWPKQTQQLRIWKKKAKKELKTWSKRKMRISELCYRDFRFTLKFPKVFFLFAWRCQWPVCCVRFACACSHVWGGRGWVGVGVRGGWVGVGVGTPSVSPSASTSGMCMIFCWAWSDLFLRPRWEHKKQSNPHTQTHTHTK